MDYDMSYIVPILAMGTFLCVLIFALVSKERVERLRKDPKAPTSSLAADSPTGGPYAPPPPPAPTQIRRL